MSSSELNVGIIGAGRVAQVHAQSIRAVDAARVAGVVDIDTRRAKEFATSYDASSYSSLEGMLDDDRIDAVVICTPTSLHAEQTVQAAEAGKHILCEKPIATTLDAADQMIAAARAADVTLMVGHVLRFMPEYVLAHELLEGGEIGAIRTLRAARMSGLVGGAWHGWLLDEEFGLGVFDTQIHDLDFLRWLLGETIQITSRGWRASAGGWAHVDSVLDYGDRCWAVVESSFAIPQTYPFTMYLRVIGERGVLEFDFKGESYAQPTVRQLTIYPPNGSPQDRTPPESNPYVDQMQQFVQSTRRGETPVQGHPKDARAALRLALAGQRSLNSGGKPVHPWA